MDFIGKLDQAAKAVISAWSVDEKTGKRSVKPAEMGKAIECIRICIKEEFGGILIPSTADGEIRTLLITNAKAGKFGNVQIDEGQSTLHMLVHVLEHIVGNPNLKTPKVYTYTGDDASRDEIRKMIREMDNAPMCVLPKGTLEQLTRHTCGFYYGPGSSFCGGCGQAVKATPVGDDGVVRGGQYNGIRLHAPVSKEALTKLGIGKEEAAFIERFGASHRECKPHVMTMVEIVGENVTDSDAELWKCGSCGATRREHDFQGVPYPRCEKCGQTMSLVDECKCKSLINGHDVGCPLGVNLCAGEMTAEDFAKSAVLVK